MRILLIISLILAWSILILLTAYHFWRFPTLSRDIRDQFYLALSFLHVVNSYLAYKIGKRKKDKTNQE